MMPVYMPKSISSAAFLRNVFCNDACIHAKINQFCYILRNVFVYDACRHTKFNQFLHFLEMCFIVMLVTMPK